MWQMRIGSWRQGIGGAVTVGLLLIYKMVMDVFYVEYVFPLYSYMNFTANPNMEDAVVAWGMYAGMLVLFRPVLWKPFVAWKFSELILFALLLFSVVPGLSMCGAGAFPKTYTMWFYIYWLLFFVFARLFSNISFRVSGLSGNLSPKDRKVLLVFVGMIVAITVACVFFLYRGELFFSNLWMQAVYEQRMDWERISKNFLFVMNYILANASVVLLFLMMYCLEDRQYLTALLLLVVAGMHFSCDASKSVLFSAAICTGVYVIHKWLSPSVMMLLLIGSVIAGMIAYDDSENVSSISLLCRNSFTPNMLSSCYWDYFQSHVPVWDIFSDYPAEEKSVIPRLIGDLYVAQNTISNNGLLGAAFMMAGRCGVIFSPIAWNIYLNILDKAGGHIASWIKLGISVSWAVVMMNSAMTTSMLSHGGVALLVLGYLSKTITPKMQGKISQTA